MRFLTVSTLMITVEVLVGSIVPAPGLAEEPLGQDRDGWAALEQGLDVTLPESGTIKHVDLDLARRELNIPSVSIALVNNGAGSSARAYGDATTHVLFQAASMSKLVTAVAALRLVQLGRLDLDRDVNTELTFWHAPTSDLTTGHPITLRGLLSMSSGVGVPGYVGYEPGSPLPTLLNILDGTPPANSPPVRVEECSRHALCLLRRWL